MAMGWVEKLRRLHHRSCNVLQSKKTESWPCVLRHDNIMAVRMVRSALPGPLAPASNDTDGGAAVFCLKAADGTLAPEPAAGQSHGFRLQTGGKTKLTKRLVDRFDLSQTPSHCSVRPVDLKQYLQCCHRDQTCAALCSWLKPLSPKKR